MEKQEEVFRELKEKFTKELVLAVPDLDKKIRIEVDVSVMIDASWRKHGLGSRV